MRNVFLCFAFLTLFGVLLLQVEGTSPRKCPDECEPCEAVSCKCGKLQDECNCCDVCMKCRDEPCSVLAGEACEEGYSCGDPSRPYLDQMQSHDDKCIPHKSQQQTIINN